MKLKCYIISKLTSKLPTCCFNIDKWSHLENLPMADPTFHTPGIIDMIIGSDYFFHIIGSKRICGEQGAPIAQETLFGWIIAGTFDNHNPVLPSTTSLHSELNLDNTLKKFWEIDQIPTQSLLTGDNIKCEEHFQRHTLCSNDRFVVRLPFKIENPTSGKSMNSALKRLENMESRFKRDIEFTEAYHKFMNEYRQLNHMEEIPVEEIDQNRQHSFYLPHHGVFETFEYHNQTSSGL